MNSGGFPKMRHAGAKTLYVEVVISRLRDIWLAQSYWGASDRGVRLRSVSHGT